MKVKITNIKIMLIKNNNFQFLTSKLAKCSHMTETYSSITTDMNQLISQENGSNITRSQSPDNSNNINMVKNDDLVGNEDEFVINNILDRLTSSEFIK